ncbi:CLUMA_CG004472, isoform A [Clunio marinus]|uniref:CLUMA_CG004472, isoform A n=1 Tax=Clunio marinus TaxID=568069 RepID=A0A1J1HTS7_9DIPT|nr:CLUMA_CG004472, isoform A [Clunio marinus]
MKIAIAVLLIACVFFVIESEASPDSKLEDLVLSGPGAAMTANQGVQKREACDSQGESDEDDRRRK